MLNGKNEAAGESVKLLYQMKSQVYEAKHVKCINLVFTNTTDRDARRAFAGLVHPYSTLISGCFCVADDWRYKKYLD